MSEFTVETLTDAVVEAYTKKAEDPRFRELIEVLIQHLHAFVKESGLTEAEWFEGIKFLTDTGQMCDDKRQEFILLSDTLGVSMLVDAINHPKSGLGTENTVLGPFFVSGAPEVPWGSNVIKKDIGGEVCLVKGRVTDPEGNPIGGAMLDIWQTAANRLYDVQDPEAPEWNLRAKMRANEDGEFAFVTEKPTSYAVPTDGPVGRLLRAGGRHAMRPAHIHFIFNAQGYNTLTTHLFASGDDYIDSDAVFAVKESLIVDFDKSDNAELGSQFGLEAPFTFVDFQFGMMPAKARAAAA